MHSLASQYSNEPTSDVNDRVPTDLESPGIGEVSEKSRNFVGGQKNSNILSDRATVAVIFGLDFYSGLFGLDFYYLFCYF